VHQHALKLDMHLYSNDLHVSQAELAPACVDLYCKLGVYVDMLACIKRQACVCARLHVLKLGTLVHSWRAGHLHVILRDSLAHDSQLHRNKDRSKHLAAEH
jgi:hypothetical protein